MKLMLLSNPKFLAVLVFCGVILSGVPAHADAGMWTFDNPPTRQLREKYH